MTTTATPLLTHNWPKMASKVDKDWLQVEKELACPFCRESKKTPPLKSKKGKLKAR